VWILIGVAEEDAVPPILNVFLSECYQVEDNQKDTLTRYEKLVRHPIQML